MKPHYKCKVGFDFYRGIAMRQTKIRFKLTGILSMCLMIFSCASIASNDQEKSNEEVSNKLLISKADEIIQHYTEPGWFSGSVVIFKGENVIYDKSFGFADIENKIENTSETKTRIGSINKHFTAVLIMQNVQSGKISLDDNLDKFELGFPKYIAEKITVRHLLKHTSGFADIFNNEYFRTYQSLKTIDDKLPLLINKPLISEPGNKFNYSNYGYIVLGAILEKLENKSFKLIIKSNILDVIKADNTKYALTEDVKSKAKSYHFSPIGNKIDRTSRLENLTPDGGMYSTPYDLALFYSKLFYSDLLLNNPSKAIMVNGYKETNKTWFEILENENTDWSSYGGGPGVSAAVDILIKDKLMVVALANTDGVVAERITQRVVEVHQGKEYKKVMLPLGLFAKNLLTEKESVYFINNAKREFSQAGYENYGARPLNKLGFALINNNQLEQAISVFIANTKIFTQEPNTFDSLASAYEKAENKTEAVLNYKKALSLDPNFESAKQAILRLSQ
jgi:CubicO group peptidase (beta-lactamase class C family)